MSETLIKYFVFAGMGRGGMDMGRGGGGMRGGGPRRFDGGNDGPGAKRGRRF